MFQFGKLPFENKTQFAFIQETDSLTNHIQKMNKNWATKNYVLL